MSTTQHLHEDLSPANESSAFWIIFLLAFGLLFLPTLRCPAWLRGLVMPVAASSYLIYLTHRLVPDVAMAGWEAWLPGWAFSTLSILCGIGLGVVLSWGQRRLGAWWAARLGGVGQVPARAV